MWMSLNRCSEPRRSMIGTFASCVPCVTCPVRCAIACATRSGADRAAVKLRSMSVPPTPSFSATNCSGVIVPAFSASRPYWTPTLRVRAAGEAVRRPEAPDRGLVVLHVQRTPVGFVVGS